MQTEIIFPRFSIGVGSNITQTKPYLYRSHRPKGYKDAKLVKSVFFNQIGRLFGNSATAMIYLLKISEVIIDEN